MADIDLLLFLASDKPKSATQMLLSSLTMTPVWCLIDSTKHRVTTILKNLLRSIPWQSILVPSRRQEFLWYLDGSYCKWCSIRAFYYNLCKPHQLACDSGKYEVHHKLQWQKAHHYELGIDVPMDRCRLLVAVASLIGWFLKRNLNEILGEWEPLKMIIKVSTL